MSFDIDPRLRRVLGSLSSAFRLLLFDRESHRGGSAGPGVLSRVAKDISACAESRRTEPPGSIAEGVEFRPIVWRVWRRSVGSTADSYAPARFRSALASIQVVARGIPASSGAC